MDKATGRKQEMRILINIQELIWMTRSTALGNLIGRLALNIEVTTSAILRKVMEKCFGIMGAYTEDIGIRECKMVWA